MEQLRSYGRGLAKVGAKVGHVLQPHCQPVPAWGMGAAPCPTELTRTVLKLFLALYSLAVLKWKKCMSMRKKQNMTSSQPL